MVTHCLCERLAIATIVDWAEARGGATLEDASARFGCSTHCGMCGPFIEYALATGERVVPWPCPPMPAKAAAER